MTWTYTDSPATVPIDAVRLLIGDTDATWKQPISDNEIGYFLEQRAGSVDYAAADAADKLAAYYSRQADTTNGKNSVSASQRAAQFAATAGTLRMRAASLAAPVGAFSGGMSIGQKQAAAQNPDAVPPSFVLGQDDEPGTTSADRSWPPQGLV